MIEKRKAPLLRNEFVSATNGTLDKHLTSVLTTIAPQSTLQRDMDRLFKKLRKSEKPMESSLTTTDALDCSGTGPTTLRSTNIANPMPFIPASAVTANLQAADIFTTHDFQVSASDSASRLEETSLTQHSGLGLFSHAHNLVINGGTFNNININNAGEGETMIPVFQKPNSSPIFTGRKDVLSKLGNIFVHRANNELMSRRSCLLWGMGGIGKTQICLKFITEMSDSFSHVFWVDASSYESITASFKGISSILFAGVDGSVESALKRIACIQEEWLMVFDNADDPPPEMVARFIPQDNRGNILITSRNRSMGRAISFENVIEIDKMEEPDAIALLLKASYLDSSAENVQAAEMIVNELGFIPLALSQAGAYIEAGRCDIKRYLRQFSLHRKTLMSDATFKGESNYNQTVYGTWDLSFSEIKKRASGKSMRGNAQAAKAAILILQICAFYHHSNISKAIFQSAAEQSRIFAVDHTLAEKLPQTLPLLDHTLLALDNDGYWDDFVFGQGLSVLLSFSLIKIGQSSEVLSVHPLMHCWSREQMSKSEQQRMCQIASIILSCAISQRGTSQDFALRRMIFPHIKANELYEMYIGVTKEYYDDKYINFELVMWENGDWENAEQLNVQIMNMRKKVLGEKHPHTMTSMGNLATTYQNQGRFYEAEQLNIQVMNMRKEVLGAEHRATITSMGNLARIYCNQGRFNEAEQLEIQVMNMRKKLLGAEHPHTILSIGNLATTYWKQGRFHEAEQLDIQVMNMKKNVLGAEHPDTIISMGNLARTYHHQGRFNEAEQLEIQVMNMSKKLIGAEHPDTILSMGNLASTYCNQGRYQEAEQLEIQVMNMRKRVLGADHPDTIRGMGNLARTYCNQGRFVEAEQLQIQVINMRKRVLGEEHPDTIRGMGYLATTYRHQARFHEAEQLEIPAMNISKKVLGTEHPDTITSMGNLASTYHHQGRLDEAEQLQIQVMNMSKRVLGAEHPDTIRGMEYLATMYCNQGRFNEAEQLEIQVMNIKKIGTEHP